MGGRGGRRHRCGNAAALGRSDDRGGQRILRRGPARACLSRGRRRRRCGIARGRRACCRVHAIEGAAARDDGAGSRFPRHHTRRLADAGAGPPRGGLGWRRRLAGRGRRRERRAWHRAHARALRLPAGLRRQPGVIGGAARPARADRWPAHACCARADGGAHGGADARHRARRYRERNVPRRYREHAPRNAIYEAVPIMTPNPHGPLRVGVGGPVGSGKTALMDALCKALRDRYEIAAITNDIYTKWDAEYLVRSGALPSERIAGVETGGCPHTAIREDASINLAAIADMQRRFPALDLVLVESGGDNLAATFSPELADITIYVIDVAAGDKIPSKGGPGITRSDLLVINKVDLAPYVGASLDVMERDAKRMRGARPFVFSNLREGRGVEEIARFIEQKGGLSR